MYKQAKKGKGDGQMAVTSPRGHLENKVAIWDAATMGITSIGSSCITGDLASVISVGADFTRNRLGRRIRAREVLIDGQIYGAQANSVADDATNAVRVTVSVARAGFAPNWTCFSPIDVRIYTGLVRVIYDKVFIINVNAKDSTGYILKAKRILERIAFDQVLDYTGTAAAAPSDRSVFLTVVSDSSAVVNPGFAGASFVTLLYSDEQ